MEAHLIINTLRNRDGNLYSHILREVDFYYLDNGMLFTEDNPYLVTMDEAMADAGMIMKEIGIKPSSGHLFISI